ncbi:MAG TPA: TraR/DksA C4-type zinc finger protein [Synergistales bacterium]|nr:TraR/DksA C4-type zinc finger protein [Synergistales bacterium]
MDLTSWHEYLEIREKELEEMLEKLVSDASNNNSEDTPSRENNDFADTASELADSERINLEILRIKESIAEIRHAFNKIDINPDKFAQCERCSKEIEEARMKAKPWARYCIRCKEQIERTKKIR